MKYNCENEELDDNKPKVPGWLKANLVLFCIIILIFVVEFLTKGDYEFNSSKGVISYIIYVIKTKLLDIGNVDF